MRYTILMISALFLSFNALAGPDTINLHIDTSYCAEKVQWDKKICEDQIDVQTGHTETCHFLPSPENELLLTLKGEAVIGISGICNGQLRSCVYHFRPSYVRNARYPSDVVTAFPNGQTLTTTLIREELAYLIVQCH